MVSAAVRTQTSTHVGRQCLWVGGLACFATTLAPRSILTTIPNSSTLAEMRIQPDSDPTARVTEEPRGKEAVGKERVKRLSHLEDWGSRRKLSWTLTEWQGILAENLREDFPHFLLHTHAHSHTCAHTHAHTASKEQGTPECWGKTPSTAQGTPLLKKPQDFNTDEEFLLPQSGDLFSN